MLKTHLNNSVVLCWSPLWWWSINVWNIKVCYEKHGNDFSEKHLSWQPKKPPFFENFLCTVETLGRFAFKGVATLTIVPIETHYMKYKCNISWSCVTLSVGIAIISDVDGVDQVACSVGFTALIIPVPVTATLTAASPTSTGACRTSAETTTLEHWSSPFRRWAEHTVFPHLKAPSLFLTHG